MIVIRLIPVSLFDNASVDDHLRLGHALAPLRDQNIMIIGGGMTVHNLRASMPILSTGGRDKVYEFTPAFNDAAVGAATAKSGDEREEDVRELYKREDLRLAHPSLEHLMPLAVCCGAAGEDRGECLFQTVEFGALGWASFCFGGTKNGDVQ
jgi:aromatic ring-opening dioxygenase catalytic subunit (LigB family)